MYVLKITSAVRTPYRESQNKEVRDTRRNDGQQHSVVVVLVHVGEKRVQVLHGPLDEKTSKALAGRPTPSTESSQGTSEVERRCCKQAGGSSLRAKRISLRVHRHGDKNLPVLALLIDTRYIFARKTET